MSKKWKFVIGIVASLVIMASIIWFALDSRQFATVYAQRPGQTTQLEVRLVDDDEDGVPDRGVVDLPARGGRFGQGGLTGPQLEVRLIDDDEDGIPDRGILDLPPPASFGRGGGPERGRGFGPDRFGPSFGPDRGRFGPGSRSFGPGRGLFFLVALLGCLTVLAVLVGLGVYLFCRQRPAVPATATPVRVAPVPATPAEAEPEETSPDNEPTEPDSR